MKWNQLQLTTYSLMSSTSPLSSAQTDASDSTWIFVVPDTLMPQGGLDGETTPFAPGAHDLVAWLHAAGVQLVALRTAGGVLTALQRRTFALDDMFDLTLDFERVGDAPPIDKISRAISLCGALPRRVILLASTSVDVHAGLQLGLQVLALRNGAGTPSEFGSAVTSYQDAAELLGLMRHRVVTTLP